MPAPLIEFAQFAHLTSWWLRRGEPPWLHDDRWWVRAFRVSLMLGLMGAASGWITAISFVTLNALESALMQIHVTEVALIFGPGFWMGAVVLLPLSRWLGRGWLLSFAVVGVSMAASYCGIMTLFFVAPIMGQSPAWIPGGRNAAGFYAGFVGALLLGIGMGNPRRLHAWLAAMLAALLAGGYCGVYFALEESATRSFLPGEMEQLLSSGLLYAGFQSMAAVGLGVRLWRKDADRHGTPDLLFRCSRQKLE